MFLAPLTYASPYSQAKKVNVEQMQSVINKIGLNRQITFGEFYKKNKYLYPERIQKIIEPMFTANKNMLMPVVEVVASKTTTGEDIPTIRVAYKNTDLINLQWFGEEEKLVKFQNTELSEVDVINFDDMLKRIYVREERIRNQLEHAKTKKTLENFTYPDISKGEWATMTPYQRANYIVNLRLLWQDARKVLQEKKQKKTKTKTDYSFYEKNLYFFKLLLGEDVEAAGKSKTVTDSKSASYFTGQTCIVAGYVARYEKTSRGEICNHEVADQAYANKDNSLYLKAKQHCAQSSQIACNPYVFGTPNGAPTCITPSKDSSFQKATHWDGPCDTASRLSTSQTQILKDSNKKNGRYEDGNLLSETERKELLKTDQGKENYKLTEEYLLGILKFRGTVKADAKALFDTDVMSEEVLKQILLDKKAFDNEIAEATKSCKAESEASKTQKRVYEKNYWEACDQLFRREMFITEIFAAKCGDNKLNPDTLKCQCAAPVATTPTGVTTAPSTSTIPEVIPGAQCKPPAIPAVPPVPPKPEEKPAPPKPEKDAENCEAKYPGAVGLNKDCLCSNGQAPSSKVAAAGSGQESWECSASAKIKTGKKDEECGLACTLLKGMNFLGPLGPILATLAIAYGGYKLLGVLAPKKPTIKPPGDVCPGTGAPPPCAQVCSGNERRSANGGCSCGDCSPGQVAQAVTCYCVTPSSGNTSQNLLCPDSQTWVTNLANCPTYPCWNGQAYQNPMNCPPAPPTTPAVPATRSTR